MEVSVFEKEYALLQKGILSKFSRIVSRDFEDDKWGGKYIVKGVFNNNPIEVILTNESVLVEDDNEMRVIYYKSLNELTNNLIRLRDYMVSGKELEGDDVEFLTYDELCRELELPVVHTIISEDTHTLIVKEEKVKKVDKNFDLDDKFALPTKRQPLEALRTNDNNKKATPPEVTIHKVSGGFVERTFEPAKLPDMPNKPKKVQVDVTYSEDDLKRYIELAMKDMELLPKLPYSIYQHLRTINNLSKSGNTITDDIKKVLLRNLVKIVNK